MTEVLISFELMTIIYIIILIPLLVFLIRLGHWFAGITIDRLRLSRNRKLIKDNRKILRENMDTANELIIIQRELRHELEKTKKELNVNDSKTICKRKKHAQ